METPPKNSSFVFRWIDFTASTGGVAAAVSLAAVTAMITYEVIMRYVFNSPTFWVGELSIFLCMAIGFLGIAYALKNDSHFAITIVVDRLSRKGRRRMRLLTNMVGLAYSLVFVVKGWEMVRFSYMINDKSSGMMEVPLWIPWLLVPTGGVLLSLQFIKKLVQDLTRAGSTQQ